MTKKERKGSAVFIGWLGNRIASREIQRFVTDYRMRAGIIKKITPHTYRHTLRSGDPKGEQHQGMPDGLAA